MTSIFNTYYSTNLHRLNSSQSERTEGEKGEGKKFAQVLSDLEKKPVKDNILGKLAKEDKAPAEAPKEPVPTYSNLRPEERIGVPAAAINVRPPLLNNVISADSPLYKSVRLGTPPVKISAPDNITDKAIPQPVAPPIETKPAAPAAPFVVEVSRLSPPQPLLPDLSEELPPTVPQLLSAERSITQPDFPPDVPRVKHAGNKRDAIKEIIATAGKYYGVDPNLSLAIAQVESAYDPKALSKDGHHSKGIFQLLDSTGRDMVGHTGLEERYDPFDPAQNAYLGVGYLRRLHDIFSEETKLGFNMKTVPASSAEHLEKLAVAAFNAGEGNVARAQAKAQSLGKDPTDFDAIEPHLPASTRVYVKKVTRLKQSLALSDTDETIA